MRFKRYLSTLAMLVAAAAGVLLVNTAALAQSAPRPEVRRQVLDAITGLADALEAGDIPLLRAAIWANERSSTERLGRELFVKLVEAEKRLEQAGLRRFGAADGARLRCAFATACPEEIRESLTKAAIYMDPAQTDFARVVREGDISAMLVRRNAAGRWQVVLDIVDELEDDYGVVPPKPDPRSQVRIDRYQALLEAVSDVATRVERGELASAAAADADLYGRVRAITADFDAKRMSIRPRWQGGRPRP